MELILILILGGLVANFACGFGRTYGQRLAEKWERPNSRLRKQR